MVPLYMIYKPVQPASRTMGEETSKSKKQKMKNKECSKNLSQKEDPSDVDTMGMETVDTVNLKTKKQKKKDKKSSKNSSQNEDSESMDTVDTVCLKTKKRKKKDKIHSENDSQTDDLEALDTNGGLDVIDSVRPKTKKEKKRKKERQSTPVSETPPVQVNEAMSKKSKKSKSKRHSEGGGDVTTEAEMCVTSTNSCKKKKKKKKNKHEDRSDISETELVVLVNGVVDTDKKRKKKRKNYPVSALEEVSCDNSAKKKKKPISPDHDMPPVDMTSGDVVESKKKKKTKGEAMQLDAEVVSAEKTLKKKKKKKKLKSDNQEVTYNVSNGEVKVKSCKKRKRDKKDDKATDRHDNANTIVIRKSKDATGVTISDTPVPRGGTGVSEIVSVSPAATEVGQWNSATFDSVDRQHKFMRLLGGFKKDKEGLNTSGSSPSGKPKKGLYGSLVLSGSTPNTNVNAAMNKEQETVFQKDLEDQFERARTFAFNKQKGIGLGFETPPEEGKKFYIDSGSSKSKKFSDD